MALVNNPCKRDKEIAYLSHMLSRTVWSPRRKKMIIKPHLTYNLPNTACVSLLADTSRPRCGNSPARDGTTNCSKRKGNESTYNDSHV